MDSPPLANQYMTGPFDIIGDVHGCFDELQELFEKLGYSIGRNNAVATNGRTVVFLGDLVDRGPKTPDVLRLAMSMVREKKALCVPGNHDMKLMRKLAGHQVKIAHGLQESLDQLAEQPPEFSQSVAGFFKNMVSHFILDEGRLIVSHAGIKEKDQGRETERIFKFALYGETNGETDAYGLPVRLDWAADYHGPGKVVYGHTPVYAPRWINNTINIDTGCVFGGSLTALRYPELELVSVKAKYCYCTTQRPFMPESEISPKSITTI